MIVKNFRSKYRAQIYHVEESLYRAYFFRKDDNNTDNLLKYNGKVATLEDKNETSLYARCKRLINEFISGKKVTEEISNKEEIEKILPEEITDQSRLLECQIFREGDILAPKDTNILTYKEVLVVYEVKDKQITALDLNTDGMILLKTYDAIDDGMDDYVVIGSIAKEVDKIRNYFAEMANIYNQTRDKIKKNLSTMMKSNEEVYKELISLIDKSESQRFLKDKMKELLINPTEEE